MDKRENIGKALGKIPSGVGILTAASEGQDAAMLASWFQQAGFEPPAILVGVNKKRAMMGAIRTSKKFALNLLHSHQKDLFAHFVKGFEPGQNPFEGVETMRKETGSAVLSHAMAYLDCEVIGEIDAGDHVIFLGKILDGGILEEGSSMVHTRRSGFNY
jgi:flavin reductase (DIM6/NTAB) family NADH-FMN oxidoreductase RutF